MNWVRAIAGVLMLSSAPAWGATLTWTANTEPDLAGYRVYQCSLQPCSRSSSNASLLAILGTATSFNIGTPAVTQYYFITAYDMANNESAGSSLATYIPAGIPPPVALPVIGASPTSLAFVATQGGTSPVTQTVSLSNQGGGTLTWTASDDMPWLTLSPASGTGNGAVTLTVNSSTLTAGSYSATVRLNATGASTVTLPVTLTVATAPVPPAIGASPTSLSFTAVQGASPAPKSLTISNTGGGTLTWTASENAPWLTLSRASGTGNGTVTLTAATSSLTSGTYAATVTMTAAGAAPVTVPVSLTVTATAPPPVVPPPTPPAAPPTPGGLHISKVN